ncbi:hypothetical protein KCU40_004438 [Vibrio vulnificus]|nr:hypothetical protein [Vibrio vulnificus]
MKLKVGVNLESEDKPRANTVFLEGMRYMLTFSLILLTCLFLFSVGLSSEGVFNATNFLIAYAGIVLTALLISFLVCYVGIKKAIDAGEAIDDKIFTRDGKLSINFFKKPSE